MPLNPLDFPEKYCEHKQTQMNYNANDLGSIRLYQSGISA